MSKHPYGDPAVDEILVAAELYAHYGILDSVRAQLDELAALPDSSARTAGLQRLEELLAGAESRYVPAPPTPYIENAPERQVVTGAVVSVGDYRRAPALANRFLGWAADDVRNFLGPPDSERPGRFWFSRETGKNLRRVGDDLVEEVVFGPVPNIAPGRPYIIWTYDKMLEPDDPDPVEDELSFSEPGSTWFLYFFTAEDGGGSPTVVFEAGSIPRKAEF